MANLEAAISKADMGVSATPENHPDWAVNLNNLGNKLLRRYEQTGNMDDLEAAPSGFLVSFECFNSVPVVRVTAARHAIRIHLWRDKLEKAALIAQRAVELIPLVCSRYLGREDQ
jgi:hypothetical protein